MPLIGHLAIDTQFRILGSVFLVSLLISIAAIFMQVQATARGTTFLSVASHIAPLTHQIPKAALAAMEGQKDGFSELREARDSFGKLLESLLEGGEVKGIKVAATSPEARPRWTPCARPGSSRTTPSTWCWPTRTASLAINRLAVEAAIRGHAMTEAAEAAGGRLPLLTERILRGAHQLAWAPGFDEATCRTPGQGYSCRAGTCAGRHAARKRFQGDDGSGAGAQRRTQAAGPGAQDRFRVCKTASAPWPATPTAWSMPMKRKSPSRTFHPSPPQSSAPSRC
jgi:hypothetical protein